MTEPLDVAPVPVHATNGISETDIFRGVSRAFSPNIRTITTFFFPASSSNPVQILPRDDRRFRATFINSGTAGVALVGDKSQVGAQAGGQFPPNAKDDTYSGQELFACALGATAAQLTVVIETFSYE